MKKITNTNDYTHSVGYQDAEKVHNNYVLQPNESVEVPDKHAELFKDTEGIVIEDIASESDKKEEVKETPKNAKKAEIFVCPECGVEFGRENVMLEHQETHKKEEVKKEENGPSTN